MEYLDFNINIISTALPLAALLNLILGTVVYIHNYRSEVNRAFFFLILSTVIWIGGIIVRFGDFSQSVALVGARITFLGAPLIAAFIFYFSNIFPKPLAYFAQSLKILVISSALLLGILGMATGSVVRSIEIIENGQMTIYGPLYYVFSAYFLFLIVASIVVLTYQYFRSHDVERNQARLILFGIGFTAIVGVITNLLIPLTTGVSTTSRLGPLGTSFFIGFATYAIVRHQLLNVKVIGTEILVATTWVVVLLRVITASTIEESIINSVLLIFWVFLGIILVRSVLGEVRAREEIEKLAKELEFTNKELKRLDQAKSDFISIASHQLRTPLSIIKGYISMIREGSYGDFSGNVRKTLNKIYLSNERLIKLVADLLDLSRMESGKLQYEFVEFNMVDMVDSTVDEFRIPAGDKNIDLVWNKPKEPLVVWGDSWKLRQVVFNLIDNGLKYTEKGSLAVVLEKANNMVTLSVKDTGAGMTPETAHGLFQKFTRGKDSFKTNAQGLGLGLFIAKKIVDDHQGKLWAESEGEGKGSAFVIELPTASAVKQKKDFQELMENL